MSNDAEALAKRRLLRVVMTSAATWGILLALGAFLFGYDAVTGTVRFSPDFRRGLIVLACVAVFVGGWGLLLWNRRR